MFDTIEFPLPEAVYRERIWRAMLATGAPLATDVDISFLSRHFELSGGNIRNVVITAAFSAAAAKTSITMRDLILATARELQKIGRLPSREDFRDYYDWIREP
jgi:ATP-dependent 26S proteasome regulatory subunit